MILPFFLKSRVVPDSECVSVRPPYLTLVSCNVYPTISPLASSGEGGDHVTVTDDVVAVALMSTGGPDGAK